MLTYSVIAKNLSKHYRIYPSRAKKLLALSGVYNCLPKAFHPSYEIFKALDNISFSALKGEKIGIIGKNGSGKSTLLKILVNLTDPSLGNIEISGSTQALMTIGLGHYEDFSGIENIRASLLYNNIPKHQFKEIEEETIDFVELGKFLYQPVRSYSLGMKARLQFATATAIFPEILIIDEILGAGDAYFGNKCVKRIEKLIKSGCTLFLVSHDINQVAHFCDRCLWIDEGILIADGKSDDIIRNYRQFIEKMTLKSAI